MHYPTTPTTLEQTPFRPVPVQVQNGHITLPAHIHLPDGETVYLLIPATEPTQSTSPQPRRTVSEILAAIAAIAERHPAPPLANPTDRYTADDYYGE